MEEVYRVLNGIKFILKSYSANKTYKCSCIAYEDDKSKHKNTCPYKKEFSDHPSPSCCVVTEFCFTIVNTSSEPFVPSANSFCMVDTAGNVYSNAHKQICAEFEAHDIHDYGWSNFVSPILPMTKAKVNIFFSSIPNEKNVAYLKYSNRYGSIQFDINRVEIENDPDFYIPSILQNVHSVVDPSEKQALSKYIEGYREDLAIEVRSSWEANIARVLKLLYIPFVFEKEMYEFNYQDYKNQRKMIRYLPDFFLQPCYKTNNQEITIEVKGTWDQESRIKVREYQKNEKLPPLYIIDYDMYYTISKLYSKIVPNWEYYSPARQMSETVQVVGINQEGRREEARKLYPGAKVWLIREPDNAYDKNAIKVLSNGRKLIGYVSSDWAPIYAQKIDIGMQYSAEVMKMEPKVITLQVKRNNTDTDILYDFLAE